MDNRTKGFLQGCVSSVGVAVALLGMLLLWGCSAAAANDMDITRLCPTKSWEGVCNIFDNHGGVVDEYDEAAHEVLRHHVRLHVVGECWSACAIAIDAVQQWGGSVCVGPYADIKIHRQRVYERHPNEAGAFYRTGRILSESDPDFSLAVRVWVAAQGGYRPAVYWNSHKTPSPDFLTMSYQDAVKIWRSC